MDEMKTFLRAIAADPGDDTPRLAFADWLDEHDRHARAEFIRLQIELERMDPSDDGYAEKTARMRRCGVFTEKGTVPFFDFLPNFEGKIAFRRGFIDGIQTEWNTERIDDSGFDLVPLQALRTSDKLLRKFRRFTKLKCLSYSVERETAPERLLELFGPGGWFTELERLNLSGVGATHFEAGVIPRFALPHLRTFDLYSEAFYYLGRTAERETDPDEDDYSPPEWLGWPDHLPRNALPNSMSPLERFDWNSRDDCDYYRNGDSFWPGPTMESLLAHLKDFNLKQIGVWTDYDDHEGGTEGPSAAPTQQNLLGLAPTLERVTLNGSDLRFLDGSKKRLKALRIFEHERTRLWPLLQQPVCAKLESLHINDRYGGWGGREEAGPAIHFAKLKFLHLSGQPLSNFANCRFPKLISLTGHNDPKMVMNGKWPKLQRLEVGGSDEDMVAVLKKLSRSGCCPNLTALTINGYFRSDETDFSFFADCPHMPFLSLIRIPDYPRERAYIINGGQLVPVREDVLLDGLVAPAPSDLSDPFA